jgi:hypothetical protein
MPASDRLQEQTADIYTYRYLIEVESEFSAGIFVAVG